jgi:hypothetical protein
VAAVPAVIDGTANTTALAENEAMSREEVAEYALDSTGNGSPKE